MLRMKKKVKKKLLKMITTEKRNISSHCVVEAILPVFRLKRKRKRVQRNHEVDLILLVPLQRMRKRIQRYHVFEATALETKVQLVGK